MTQRPLHNMVSSPAFIGVVSFLFLLGLTQYLSYERYQLLKEAELRELNDEANAARERLQTVLSYNLSTAQTLGFIVEKYGVPNDFNSMGTKLLRNNKFADAVQLVDEHGIITHVYPLKGNEVVVGYNILSDTLRSSGAFSAIESGKFFWAGPIPLKQGGAGIIGRQPLYRDNKFYGFSAVIVRLNTFLQGAGIDPSHPGIFMYQLSRVDPLTKSEEFFLPHNNEVQNAHAIPVQIPNGEWKLYVNRKSGPAVYMAATFSLLGLILSIISGLLAWLMARQPARLSELVKEKTAQLATSEQYYRALIEKSSDAIVLMDVHGKIIYQSPSTTTISGYGRTELNGVDSVSLIHPDDREADTDFFETLRLQPGASAIRTHRFRHKNGNYTWIEGTYTNLLHDKNVNAIVFNYHDITERIKSDSEVLQVYKEKETVLNRINDGVVSLDLNWRYTFLNDAAMIAHPQGREEVLGKSIWEVHPEMNNTIFRQLYFEAMSTGQVTEGEDFYAPFNTFFSVKAYPSKDGLTIFYKDVTKEKHAQLAIMREKNLSDSIINSMPGVFYLYDKTGKFLRWNKNFETITGYTDSEITTMHPLDFFEGEDKALLEAKIGEVFVKGHAEVEAPFVTKDGRKIDYYFNGHITRFDGEDYLIGMGIDITERKRAEKEIITERNLSASIINSLPGIFYLADFNGRLLRWNKNFETVSGYSGEEIKTMRVIQFVHANERDELLNKKEMAIRQGVSDVEANFLSKQHHKFPYHFTSLLSTYNDQPCLLGVGIDITDRKKAQEALLARTMELNERVKELNCLYQVSEVSNNSALSVAEIARQCVDLIVSSYQYVAVTCARIQFQDSVYQTKNFKQKQWRQQADIVIQGRIEGFIEVCYLEERPQEQEGPFLKEERWLINSVAKVISTALERKKAEEETLKSQMELRQLSAHLQTVREEERTSIAREIHDELGQQLTGLKMDASWLKKLTQDNASVEKLQSMMALIDDTIKTVRRISSDLRPGILDDLGLPAALEWQCNEFEKRTGIACNFVAASDIVTTFNRDVATGVFRIYQESLTNVARHANARHMTTTVKQNGQELILTVNDDGEGFDTSNVDNKKTLGLVGMRERALMFNGKLTINSEIKKGTTIVLTVPLDLQKN